MGTAAKSTQQKLKPRFEPPTLEDALYAAEGLTDDRDQQLELAAELMRVPVEEVRVAAAPLLKAAASRLAVDTGRGVSRQVVVEYKNARKFSLAPRSPSAAASRFYS